MNQIFLTGLLIISLLSATVRAVAAKPGPYGFWGIYYANVAVTDKWGIWAEAQYRAYDFTGDPEQLLLRTAVTYNLRPDGNQQIAQGYAYVHSEPYISGTEQKRITKEHRLYQQLMLKQRYGRLYLTHRYRVEERFLPEDFRVRFRYFLGGNLCLNKRDLVKGTLFLSMYNELFLHSDRPVFDRDRLYGGVGYGISRDVRLETGSMWQLQELTSRPQMLVTLWHNIRL